MPIIPSRRAFLRACAAGPVAVVLAACSQTLNTPTNAPEPTAAPTNLPAPTLVPTSAPEPTNLPEPAAAPTVVPTSAPEPTAVPVQALAPTPACDDDDDSTPAQTEGPYFMANSPERASLIEAGITGTRLVVSGLVRSTDCQNVARALLEFWHCDAAGVYDNVGFHLRGHQFTDDQGRYTLETIVPGVYPGRTRHIHVKVQAPNQPTLTTQLYFPDEPGNVSDSIFRPELVMAVQDAADGKAAAFDFVLALG